MRVKNIFLMRGKNNSPEGGEAFFEERVFYSERGDASPYKSGEAFSVHSFNLCMIWDIIRA